MSCSYHYYGSLEIITSPCNPRALPVPTWAAFGVYPRSWGVRASFLMIDREWGPHLHSHIHTWEKPISTCKDTSKVWTQYLQWIFEDINWYLLVLLMSEIFGPFRHFYWGCDVVWQCHDPTGLLDLSALQQVKIRLCHCLVLSLSMKKKLPSLAYIPSSHICNWKWMHGEG